MLLDNNIAGPFFETEVRERLAWFIRLRWLAALGIAMGGAIVCVWTESLHAMPVCAVGLGVGLYNGFFVALYNRLRRCATTADQYRRFALWQMGADWLALAVLLCLSGGIQSAIAPAFVFHLIIGGLLIPGRACYALACIGTGVLGALALFEIAGVHLPTFLPPQTMWEASGAAAVVLRWAALGSAFLITAYLTVSISERLREKERELKALHEEKVWFMRTTTHQLRAPLAAIYGLLEALPFAGPLSEKQTALVERCVARLKEPLDMIHDLLELAALQRPTPEQQAQPIALFECLAGVLETTRTRAEAKHIQLVVNAPNKVITVFSLPEDVRRIFSNLLDNAVKYTPVGGRVTFGAHLEGGWVRTCVCDTGIGIEKEDRERIFKDFFRSEKAKATGELGTGLGLSIVKQLVARWGGELRLESEPGKGSQFEVWLPALEKGAGRNL